MAPGVSHLGRNLGAAELGLQERPGCFCPLTWGLDLDDQPRLSSAHLTALRGARCPLPAFSCHQQDVTRCSRCSSSWDANLRLRAHGGETHHPSPLTHHPCHGGPALLSSRCGAWPGPLGLWPLCVAHPVPGTLSLWDGAAPGSPQGSCGSVLMAVVCVGEQCGGLRAQLPPLSGCGGSLPTSLTGTRAPGRALRGVGSDGFRGSAGLCPCPNTRLKLQTGTRNCKSLCQHQAAHEGQAGVSACGCHRGWRT